MSITIISPKRSVLYRPKIFILVIVASVILWSLMRNSLDVLILLVIAGLFIYGLKKPLWIMAALIVSQLTLTGYMVTTPFFISLRLLLLFLTILVMGKAFLRREVDIGPGARRIIIPMILLIAIGLLANLTNVGFDEAFKDFRNMLVGLLFAVFFVAIINTNKQLKIICIVTCLVIAASAVIGILQHFNILGMTDATVIPGFLTNSPEDQRVPGITESELELAYVLSATLVIILCLYLTKMVSSGRKLLLISMVLIFTALYFTYTRSALFAWGLGVTALVLFIKTRIKWELILVILFLVIGFFVQTDILGKTYFSGRSERSQLESSVSRTILWQAAVGTAIANPVLGIGANQFISVSPQYATSVDPSLIKWEQDRYWDWRTLGTLAPHNDFLNVWVSYGTIALIMYVWLHFTIVKNCFLSFKNSKNRFIKGLALGLAAALVTYMANSFYHNISGTLPLLWIIAGFSAATIKLAAKIKDGQEISQPKRLSANT